MRRFSFLSEIVEMIGVQLANVAGFFLKTSKQRLVMPYGLNVYPKGKSRGLSVAVGENEFVVLAVSGEKDGLGEGDVMVSDYRQNILHMGDSYLKLESGKRKIWMSKDALSVSDGTNEIVADSSGMRLKGKELTLDFDKVINKGDLENEGKIASEKVIESKEDLKANGKGFLSHTHTGNMGAPTSPPN